VLRRQLRYVPCRLLSSRHVHRLTAAHPILQQAMIMMMIDDNNDDDVDDDVELDGMFSQRCLCPNKWTNN